MIIAFPDKTIVYVGSFNPVKLKAVDNAFSKFAYDLKVLPTKASSEVPNQPIGLEVIVRGSINRAKHALENALKKKKS